MKKEKSRKQTTIINKCFPDSLMDFFHNKVYKKLSDQHITILSETPFLHLFAFPTGTQSNNAVLHQILLMWDNNKHCFSFKGSNLYFTSEEVSLVMCLPSKGQDVSYSRAYSRAKPYNSALRCKYFSPNKHITKPQIERAILDALDKNHAPNDVVGLLVMYLFTTVLFPQSSGYVPVHMFQYVEDVENISKYNWGDAVYGMLKDNIPSCSLWCHQMENGGVDSGGSSNEDEETGETEIRAKGQLPGCTLALIVSCCNSHWLKKFTFCIV